MFNLVDTGATRFGGIDILVNNAQSFTPFTPIMDAPDSHYQTHFGTGFYPCLWTSQAVFPHMKEKGRGCIIHISSSRALSGMRYSADYNANKAAHENLARTMANEWGKFGITVNCISPGAETPAYRGYKAEHPQAMAQLEAAIPMRRLADPEKDVAGAIIGLASDHARFITGQNFYVDGGIWAVAPAH
jgi:NAD(P)-dependent dehydrogenase (short-subunit alcohol dehydrogenase family)